jgi:hypothetical protein
MKRGGKFGELLERAKRGERLHLPYENAEFAALEDVHHALTNERPLDDLHRDFLLTVVEEHMLHGCEGALESWHDDERQRDLLCAKHWLDVGKQAYGGQRLRDEAVALKLRRYAVHLLKHYRPKTSINHLDLHGFKKVPSADLIDYAREYMPQAEAKMQASARTLARSRGRG